MQLVSQLKSLVMRFTNFGTTKFDEKTARRIQAINIVIFIIIAFMSVIVVFMLMQQEWGWKYSAQKIGILFVLLMPVLFAHKIGYHTKVIAFISWFLVSVVWQVTSGLDYGLHLFLLASPVALMFFLGSGQKYMVGVLSTLSTMLFLLVYFTVPDVVDLDETLYDALRIPFVDSFDIDASDYIFIMNVVVLELMLFTTTFVAFSTIEKSEVALEREYARSEMLLQSLLPKTIASRLKDHPDDLIADQLDDVSILFADIEGFTKRSSEQSAENVVGMLNRIFSEFDKLADKYNLEKIKTIGDAYMVAGGMPEKRTGHASALADMALEMITTADELSDELGETIAVRIGLHSGPAVAGVIGRRKPFYDVWGDTINVASRMESSGFAGRIQITAELKEILGPNYNFEERGSIKIKGKGEMMVYFLNERSK